MSDFFPGPLPGQQPTAGQTPPPAWPGQPPAWPGQPPPGWPTPPPGGSGMSAGVKALVVVGIVIGSFVVIGILAAVAIPVFLDQRAKSEAAATTVAIPEQVAGLTRLHDAKSLEMEQQLRSQPGSPEAGVFGVDGSLRAAVSATRRRMTSADDNGFLRGAEASFQTAGSQVVFSDTYPGHLGGTVRCAVTDRYSVCLFADHGAYGSVTLFGDMVGRTDVAVSIREAVEHRS